jgi:hypothetical protein
MNEEEFYPIYLSALEKALENDHINHGFYVFGPEDYVEKEVAKSLEIFIENNQKDRSFFDLVDLYFDAKAHNFDKINGVDIAIYKSKIKELMMMYL